ncbi:PIF1-like helicase [Hirsutella rhossiliensis]
MCVHRPGLAWSPRATCYPGFAKSDPSIARIPGHCRPPAHGDGRDNRLPHTSNHTLQPFQHHPTNLAHQFTINTRQSASSSNSHKAAGDNIRTTLLDLLPRQHQCRINGLNAKAIARTPACPLVVASHRSLDLQTLLESRPIYPTSPCPNSRLDTVGTRLAQPHAMPIQLPTTVKKGVLQYYHNLFLSFTLIRDYWTFFLRSLTHTNLTVRRPPTSRNIAITPTQLPTPYFTHDHRTRWSRLLENLASSFPHTPASDLSPSLPDPSHEPSFEQQENLLYRMPTSTLPNPPLHFHGDHICHVLTMSASQLNPENAGADMSMMAFVQPGCPSRFAYQNEHRVKGLNAETLARVFLPTPSWLSTPEYAAIRSDPDNPSTCIFLSLNISIYNQQIIPSEWTEQWFFMVGRVHPFALTFESEDDNITEYTIPALIVRDHSYQPHPRTLGSADAFPAIQPIVSFTGPVIGSGRDLLHGNSAAALDDTQLSCCGFVQLSTFICPGIPGKTPFKGFHPFQLFKMTERRDSQFQPNALLTCTGKIAGLLDHQIMTHAPAFEQDYIFIVVPDTWTFLDRAMSNQASATQLLPTTPKGSVGNPRTIAMRWPGLPLPKTQCRPKRRLPRRLHLGQSILMMTSKRSLPDPDQTPTKRPRLSPEISTIVAACDSRGPAKSDTSSLLSHEDPETQRRTPSQSITQPHPPLALSDLRRQSLPDRTAPDIRPRIFCKATNETTQHDKEHVSSSSNSTFHSPTHALPTHNSLHPCRLSTPFAPLQSKISLQRPSLPPRRSVSVSLTIMLYVSRRISISYLLSHSSSCLPLTSPVSYLLSPTLSSPRLSPVAIANFRSERPLCASRGWRAFPSSPRLIQPEGRSTQSERFEHKTSSDWLIGLACAQLVRGLVTGQLGRLSKSFQFFLSSIHAINLLDSPVILSLLAMEDDIPQAVRNCHTCKQDLPEVEFRSVKDPTKFTRDCASCRARRKERVTESRAAVAAMRNFALRLSPRRATKRTDSLANLTPPRRAAPTPADCLDLCRGHLPQARNANSSRHSPIGFCCARHAYTEGIASYPPSLLPQSRRRGRYTRRVNINPGHGHSLKSDTLVREFYTALNDDKMHSCIRCQERWFDMKRNSLKICSRCISRDRKKGPNEPYFFSAANNLDFGEVPSDLPDLTMVEEMLIARVHVHVKVLQVRGAQYKYRGHVVHFLRNVGRLFEELPVLPEELDVVLLRPPNMEGSPRFRQQFARDLRVRRSCLLAWLHYLQRHHRGYRDIVVSQNRLHRLPLDGNIVDSIASQVADIPDGEVPKGPVEEAVEEDPSDADASAIPNLQVTDTELNALQSRFLDDAAAFSSQDPHRRIQPFPAAANACIPYPDGKADFVEPRLRSITFQDYLAHAMRWHDGRFARHKTWPFVALNTLLRAQVRKRSDYLVKQRDSRRQPLTRADLEEAMAEPDEPEAQVLIQSITRQAAVIRAPGRGADGSIRQLLRDNAHIAAYHFHKRYALFRAIVLKQKFNLTDSWGRYEWQGRGSSHHHGLYWLSGHPDLDPDNDQSREQFARIWGYHVSAVNPEPQRIQAPGEGNPLIGNLLEHPLTVQFLSMVVNRVQRHRCNNYCMQLNKHTKQRLLASLDKVPHSKHWSFRGERNDGQINHYNRLLTVAWLANTDVSPCTSLQQVIDYAAKYCSKSEKKSESFAQIGKALMPRVKDHNPLISFTSKLLNQLVAERDYSKQEVSHLLLGLPLQEGSRTCLYAFPLLRIDGDEVDEAPTFTKTLADLSYVSFLKCWNFRPRDPSKWKQWQPGNINGRPRVLVYFPRYQADPEGQQWSDYFDGQLFGSHAEAFSYCWQHHSHGDDHYGRPKEARLQPQDDQYEALPEDLDLLGRRDIDINYDWTQHVGTYPELRDGYWKDLIASHPMANDVEVLGPHWRNTLNTQQRLVYDTFMGHFQAQNPAQILLHVDGGGGTGKSFLIKVLSSHLQAAALPNPSPICRVAPTGVASNQIQGSTIHSLLRLPVGGTFTDLPPADAAALQSRLRHIKYLVIDEKSMLGLEQLARIDSRLRQAFPQRNLEFFGGVSVVLVGDFFQLPPVRQKPLYSTSTGLSSLERRGQVAYRLFDRTVFLTTAQRQAGDDQAQFRQALQELRDVKLSIPSWNLLSNRDRFASVFYKARVNQYNHEHMVHLNAPAIQVEAKNHGNGAGQAPSNNAGNLSNKFPVAKGTRVMLTTNLWQSAGLVNGAQGTVYDIAWSAGADPLEDPPAVIMVDFDSYDGPPYLTTNEGRKISPHPANLRSHAVSPNRGSLTKDKIVTDLATRDFQAGISYVAVSRVTSLQGLLLEAPFDRQSLYNHTPTEGYTPAFPTCASLTNNGVRVNS